MSCLRFEIFAPESASKGDNALRLEPNRYRRQTKGLRQQGGALGSGAHKRLAEALDRFAFEVTLSTSDWLLRARNRETPPPGLEPANVLKAAERKMRAPKTSQEIDTSRTRRIPLVDRGERDLRIGHLDLLALPRR